INAFDACVVAGLDAEGLAATAVPNDVALLVSFRPLAIGTGDLLAWDQHSRPILVPVDMALALHRLVNHVVEILSRLVVRRDDESRLRIFDVLVCNRLQTLLARADFMHAALVIELFDRTLYLSA